jgi:hypothetical protein
MTNPIEQLVHLRAVMVRMAQEVEAVCDDVNGKRAAKAKLKAESLARRMRGEAMSPAMVAACKRPASDFVDLMTQSIAEIRSAPNAPILGKPDHA